MAEIRRFFTAGLWRDGWLLGGPAGRRRLLDASTAPVVDAYPKVRGAMRDEPTVPARQQQAAPEPAAIFGPAGTRDFADADEIRRMQDGVRDWVQHTARRGKDGLRTASPTILLAALCASAFCPLLLVGGVAGAGLAVVSSVGAGSSLRSSRTRSADCVSAT